MVLLSVDFQPILRPLKVKSMVLISMTSVTTLVENFAIDIRF